MAFAVVLLSGVGPAFAYEEPTHMRMGRFAVEASQLNADADFLSSLGLRKLPPSNDTGQVFPGSDGFRRSIRELVAFGTDWEDARIQSRQPLRHFYNPLNGEPLTLPFDFQFIEDGSQRFSSPSPDWALEDTTDYLEQPFSYKDAREAFYIALTSVDKTTREENWGKTFQSLGHVMHHLQDMASPQHVRNDFHCDNSKCQRWAELPPRNPAWYHESLFEKRARRFPPADSLFQGYPPVVSPTSHREFTTPRKLWKTADGAQVSGFGISEYTNRGFVSILTINSPDFPEPVLAASSSASLVDLCEEAALNSLLPCDFTPQPGDTIDFFGNMVTDTFDSTQNAQNDRAASFSIFDENLVRLNRPPVFSVNRFNIDAAYAFLLKRATAYSAGLINYFFRGKLSVSAPEPQGLIGIIDQLPDDPVEGAAFTRIKLALRNETPPITAGNALVEQDMSNGTLVAVARFHVDECYAADPGTGVHLASAPGTPICRGLNESVVVSHEQFIGGSGARIPMGNSPPEVFEFTFPIPIPVNATDLSIQVVYRGQFGEESDGVVTQNLDTSEPTLVTATNDLDYYWKDGAATIGGDRPTDTKASVIFIFTSGGTPQGPLSGYTTSVAPLFPGKQVGVWVLLDKRSTVRFAAVDCTSCAFELNDILDVLDPRRVETPPSGLEAVLVSRTPFPIRNLFATNNFHFFEKPPAGTASCGNLDTLAACITHHYTEPYNPVTPSVHVTPVY